MDAKRYALEIAQSLNLPSSDEPYVEGVIAEAMRAAELDMRERCMAAVDSLKQESRIANGILDAARRTIVLLEPRSDK